jgi:hypothetical protein
MSRAWEAVISVVMGVVVSILTNLITSNFTVPLAAGLAAAVLAWVILTFAFQSRPAADASTSTTHGPSSPIINASGNSGNIAVNSPFSSLDARRRGGEGGATK